jgi:hypothetical protein
MIYTPFVGQEAAYRCGIACGAIPTEHERCLEALDAEYAEEVRRLAALEARQVGVADAAHRLIDELKAEIGLARMRLPLRFMMESLEEALGLTSVCRDTATQAERTGTQK